jgi:hypothetical protein
MTRPSSVQGQLLGQSVGTRQEHSKLVGHAPPWQLAQLPEGPPHTSVGLVAPR